MSNFTDFISGGGSASFPTIFLHNSQTWVPPQDGNIMIHVIGAGGSGAGHVGSYIQSGAAGGYCRKNSLAVTTSGSFTVVIGAGGASVVGAVGAGSAGGTTSVAGTGLGSTLTATGGAGGTYSATGTPVPDYNVGGVGSNGDFNSNGGRGGYLIGGGAVGLTGTGNDGGTTNSSGGSPTYGGNCDVLGNFYSSSLGQISGGGGGAIGTGDSGLNLPAGELAGGGGAYIQRNAVASHASIGGGGGFGLATTATNELSGRGGEGCVVIQYIP